MECMPRGLLLFTSVSHLAHGRLCPLLGYKPHFSCFILYWPRTMPILGLWIEGESPDGAPQLLSSK